MEENNIEPIGAALAAAEQNEAMLMDRVAELYSACASAFEDQSPLKGKGLVIKNFAEDVVVAVTADEPVEFEGKGLMRCNIEPFYFYVWRSGWLLAVVGPDGGPIVGGQETEDDLLRIIKKGASA